MPNHGHAIVCPMPNYLLSNILKSWKQFTSRRAKKILNMGEEPFWQPESYDHWIRNDKEKARIARYIRNNPVAAGLCARPEDWKWSSAVLRSDVAQTSPPPGGFAAANKSAVSRFPNPQSVRARTLRRLGNRRYSRFGNLRYIKTKQPPRGFRAAAAVRTVSRRR